MQFSLTSPTGATVPILPTSQEMDRQQRESSGIELVRANCCVCQKTFEDLFVNKKKRNNKIIFCASKCYEVFKNNVVIKKTEEKDKEKPNQLKIAYTGKP